MVSVHGLYAVEGWTDHAKPRVILGECVARSEADIFAVLGLRFLEPFERSIVDPFASLPKR